MDTPGFDDTNISDANTLKSIAKSLVDAFHDRAEIQGALYVHPVTEARMRGSGRKNLIMFKKVLGMNGMANCRLVTTKWSLQPESVSIAREQELCEKEDFWQPLLAAGAQTVRFRDTMQSAINIIRPLIQGPAFEPLLVEEVVRDNKTLTQTQAGQVVNDDIGEANKAHRAEIAELRAEEEKAKAERDLEFAELLRTEREEHEAKLGQLEVDKELLAQLVSSRKSGEFVRWIARASAIFVGALGTVLAGPILAPAALLLYGATEAAISPHSR
jgi:hypothetical protein